MATRKKTAKKKKKAPARKAAPARNGAGAKRAATKKQAPAKKNGAPARTSARSRGVTVEAYLAKIPAPLRAIAERIHALVAEVAPEARASIKWGQPVWEHGGPFAFLRRSAKHVTFGFWRGADMDDPKRALEGEGTRMRHLKIAPGSGPDHETIRDFVRQAIRLNRDHGDPTKRG